MEEHTTSGPSRLSDTFAALGGDLPVARGVEEELQEKNRYLEAIFGRSGIGITVLGPDRRILQANPAMEEMLGYGPGELNGKPVAEISHPDDERKNLEKYQQMMSGQLDRFQMEKRYFRKDGTLIHALLHVTYIPDPQGTPRYFVGMLEDIAERKRIEEDLERNIALSNAVKDAQDLFIGGGDRGLVFESLLQILVKLTGSEYGFLDEVFREPDGTPFKKNLAMSNIAWDDESRKVYRELRARNLEFRNLENLSGAPVTEGTLVISNAPATDPRSGGLPQGHPPLHSFMGIPLRCAGEVIGVAGVANRPGGYDEAVARFIEPLVSTCASIISAIRNEEARNVLNDEVRDSLRQKVTLLKEVHHRVKNNLQVVSSLINLQARELQGSPAYEKFTETRDRIKAMAMIHERLYQSGDFSAVDMKAYITEFAESVFRSQQPGQRRIGFQSVVAGVSLGVDDAIPCALIINELVTNSLKHAFIDREAGEIVLEMRKLPEGLVEFEVRDNGTGLPETFDLHSARTLGLELVRGLVVQLGGMLEAGGDGGARFAVRFAPKPLRPDPA